MTTIIGCVSCPVTTCNAMYRGSACALSRHKAGVDFDPKTNAEAILSWDENELRHVLIDYFSRWANCGDSTIYDLTKVKEAFAIGNISIDDFVEWDESRITELVDEFITWLKEPASKETKR